MEGSLESHDKALKKSEVKWGITNHRANTKNLMLQITLISNSYTTQTF